MKESIIRKKLLRGYGNLLFFVIAVFVGIGILVSLNFILQAYRQHNQVKETKSSKYFIIHYSGGKERMDAFSKFADGYIDELRTDFFQPQFSYPIHAYVFLDRSTFESYCVKHLGVSDPLFGIYVRQIRAFFTYQDSGLGTFAHEIMHPLLEHNFPRAPRWCKEGIPAFFEKFFGYFSGNRLILSFGFQNPWRLKDIEDDLESLDLRGLVEGKNDNQSELRLVATFIHERVSLRRYFELLRDKPSVPPIRGLEIVFGKPFSEIEKIWDRYLQELKRDIRKFDKTPLSYVAPDLNAYNRFLGEHPELSDRRKRVVRD